MTKATQTMWRVQVRENHAAKWKNKGLFETRERARHEVEFLRDHTECEPNVWVDGGVGFRNTRVLRKDAK